MDYEEQLRRKHARREAVYQVFAVVGVIIAVAALVALSIWADIAWIRAVQR